jgi:hypothetical protein
MVYGRWSRMLARASLVIPRHSRPIKPRPHTPSKLVVPLNVVRLAEPCNIKRAGIVIVMRFNLFASAPFAWHRDKASTSASSAHFSVGFPSKFAFLVSHRVGCVSSSVRR